MAAARVCVPGVADLSRVVSRRTRCDAPRQDTTRRGARGRQSTRRTLIDVWSGQRQMTRIPRRTGARRATRRLPLSPPAAAAVSSSSRHRRLSAGTAAGGASAGAGLSRILFTRLAGAWLALVNRPSPQSRGSRNAVHDAGAGSRPASAARAARRVVCNYCGRVRQASREVMWGGHMRLCVCWMPRSPQ